MSAQKLREAASKLRESAEAATTGPWEAGAEPTKYAPYEGSVRSLGMAEDFSDEIGQMVDYTDSVYIALMAPPVALALADALSHASYTAYRGPAAPLIDVLDHLADAILGSDS
jgi:hypothetical protein